VPTIFVNVADEIKRPVRQRAPRHTRQRVTASSVPRLALPQRAFGLDIGDDAEPRVDRLACRVEHGIRLAEHEPKRTVGNANRKFSAIRSVVFARRLPVGEHGIAIVEMHDGEIAEVDQRRWIATTQVSPALRYIGKRTIAPGDKRRDGK